MKKGRIFTAIIVLALMASIIGTAAVATANGGSHAYSQNIALVPNATGLYNHGGTLPTGNFPNLEGGGTYTPSFTNLHPDTIKNATTCPIVDGNYDTVVLNSIEDDDYLYPYYDNRGDYLNDATFLQRIHDFVFNGGKLIIYTSETASNPYWANFVRPFSTTNPGDAGYTDTPFSVTEENTLSSADSSNFYYINCYDVTDLTDAVGDANVFTSYDGRWCEDMEGQNELGTLGPVHAYSHYGSGLIIYNALDIDWLAGNTFTSPYNNGAYHLGLIWAYELMQPWNPSGLPCTAPVGNLLLDCGSTTNDVDTEHCVTATLTDDDDLPVNGADITFTVTGVNPTGPTVVKTDINGEAEFCYTGTNTGKDIIIATCDDPEGSGIPLTSNECEKEWIPGEEPPPPIEVGGDVSPVNRISLLVPWIGLAAIAAAIAGITLVLKRRRI